MFSVVSYNGEKFGIYDSDDNTVELVGKDELVYIVRDLKINISGVSYNGDENKLFNINGLKVQINYPKKFKVGSWTVVLLTKGDRFGLSLSRVINRPTVYFYDNRNANSKRILGQFVAAYNYETIMSHTGDLNLDLDVPSWKLSAEMIEVAKQKLSFLYENL